jgi:hypothetical protein
MRIRLTQPTSSSWNWGLAELGNKLNCLSCAKLFHLIENSWDPYTLTVKNKDEVAHLEAANYMYECKMRSREILWQKLAEATK